MKEVKTQRSRSYREYLISSLKDPEHAAAFIEVMLELDEEGFEPELLRSALKDVVDAREQMNNLSEEAKQLIRENVTLIPSFIKDVRSLSSRLPLAQSDRIIHTKRDRESTVSATKPT